MNIPKDLIYEDVELVQEFDDATYAQEREIIRYSLVFNLSHSKPKNEYKWDNGYQFRTILGVHVYSERALSRNAEVTVKVSVDVGCTKESKKLYVETLKKAFGGVMPKMVCVITNLEQDVVAIGNIKTNQFMYIHGKPELIRKEDVIKGILSYIRLE